MDTVVAAVAVTVVVAAVVDAVVVAAAVSASVAAAVFTAAAAAVTVAAVAGGLVNILFQIRMKKTALRTENMTDTPGTVQNVCIFCATVVMVTAALKGSSVFAKDNGFMTDWY